ncbi:MAG: large conductance mechanosensitive channel protein MscL [Oscillospiraceae bacterium]
MDTGKLKKPGILAEFQAFIARGNVMDLAVGVIVGGAFKSISDSLVSDILMPLVGIFVKQETFANLSFRIAGADILFGSFIQAAVNFLVIALVVFLLVKGMNRLHKKEEAPPPAPAAPSQEELLLTEIRDLLRENRG